MTHDIFRKAAFHGSVAGFLLAFASVVALAAQPPRVGTEAPTFTLPDEQGRVHSLSDYRGKLVVLEWTNPQCPYVARHYRADTMEELAREYQREYQREDQREDQHEDQGERQGEVVWLAVNSTASNTAQQSRDWKQKQGFHYATLQDVDGKVGHLYGARTTPNMYVIDAAGVLRYSGAIDDDPRGESDAPDNHVSAAIRAILADEDPDPSETRPYGCSVKYQ